MSISERIFAKMGQDKSHLRALAVALNIAPSTVTSWKVRGSDPPAKYIVEIANFLQVSPLWLLTGQESTAAKPPKAEKAPTVPEPASANTALANHTAAHSLQPSAADSHILDTDQRELLDLFNSLERPGRTIMLSAGYKEQRRQQEALKTVLGDLRQPSQCKSGQCNG